MTIAARLAIVGDYDPAMYTHRAIEESLGHVRELREHALEWSWIGTPALADNPYAGLALADGVWVAPASPYKSLDGALGAIRVARERGLPLLAVCGGFQHAVLEFARNVVGIADAQHAELSPESTTAVITALACSLVEKAGPVFLDPTCRTASIYGRWRIVERYHCHYGLNPEYRAVLERSGLHIVGEDDHGDARVAELRGHPFYIATLFQPQLNSSSGSPAPLVRALVDAAIHHRDRRATPGGSEALASVE
jgi:CTP synthase (UTP-ammonia lyase)